MSDRTGDPHLTQTARMIPRAFVGDEGSVTYATNMGTLTYREIYTSIAENHRYLIAELPIGMPQSILATDMWDTRHGSFGISIGEFKWFETVEQAIMATVLTISNQPNSMRLWSTQLKVTHGCILIDERNLCHVKYR